jgi:uncharacterized repeat protein (TIGR02543 family)
VTAVGGWYDAGAPVTVTATPSNGYHFAGWSGDAQGDTNSLALNLTMDQARTVTASFAANKPAQECTVFSFR